MKTLTYFLSLLLCVSSAFAIGKVGPAVASFNTCVVGGPWFGEVYSEDLNISIIKGTSLDSTAIDVQLGGTNFITFTAEGITATLAAHNKYLLTGTYEPGGAGTDGLTISGIWKYNTGATATPITDPMNGTQIAPYIVGGVANSVSVLFVVTSVNATATDIEIKTYDFPVTLTMDVFTF